MRRKIIAGVSFFCGFSSFSGCTFLLVFSFYLEKPSEGTRQSLLTKVRCHSFCWIFVSHVQFLVLNLVASTLFSSNFFIELPKDVPFIVLVGRLFGLHFMVLLLFHIRFQLLPIIK
eukprot:TRINITY_DN10717_c0_g1_i2.p1 TRINITY_DN10717_c0_g1~~TRINITY_DN10717_c0_g1_i2.p1  ORF type:complete len:116 (+),score=4.40 TRINITY_DN10717_c0_g1_i2:379-726(+)